MLPKHPSWQIDDVLEWELYSYIEEYSSEFLCWRHPSCGFFYAWQPGPFHKLIPRELSILNMNNRHLPSLGWEAIPKDGYK